jgi:hypothetical protein
MPRAPLGKHQHGFVFLEQALAHLGIADDLPRAYEELRDEWQLGAPALDHAAHDARQGSV